MNVLRQLALGCLVLAWTGVAHAQNVHGVLRVVKGDVQIKSAKSGQTAKARIGEKVYPKDVIVTGKDARAKVVMVDNNEINVSPESQIEIQTYEYDPANGKKDVLLNVIYGKVRSKVEQKYDGKTSKFQVKTPSAVAGVRGTDFMTSFNRSNGSSQVVTFHGKVDFGLPGPNGAIMNAVSVTPGTMASNAPGQAPGAPAPVPQEEIAKMDQDTKAEAPSTAGGAADSGGDSRAPAAGTKDNNKDGSKNQNNGQGQGPDQGGGEGSAPAGGGASSPGKGSGKSDGSGKGASATGNAPANGGSGSQGARAPASTAGSGSPPPPPAGGGSMIDAGKDLAGSGGPPPPPIVGGPVIINPVAPPPVQQCDICTRVIEGGTANVFIRVRSQ